MNFFRMVFYKIKLIISNRIILFFLITLPIVTAYISGYSSKIEQLNVVPIAIVDKDSTFTSKQLIERISRNDEIKVYNLDLLQAQKYLKDSKIESFFVLEKGFEQKIKQLSPGGIIKVATHQISPNTEFVKEVIAGEVNRVFSAYYTFETIKSTYEQKGITPENNLFEKVNMTIESYWNPPIATYNFSWSDNNKNNSIVNSPLSSSTLKPNSTYHGTTLMFIMLFVIYGSTWITEERNNHILLRMHGTKKAFLLNFLANKSALLFCGLSIQVIISLIIKIVFSVNVINGINEVVIYLLYTFFAASLGVLLGSMVKSPITLQSITAPVVFILSFIGGCFFNLSELSKKAVTMTLITPQGWALKGLNSDFYMAAFVLFTGSIIVSFASYRILRSSSLE